jgi:hypothetical protein
VRVWAIVYTSTLSWYLIVRFFHQWKQTWCEVRGFYIIDRFIHVGYLIVSNCRCCPYFWKLVLNVKSSWEIISISETMPLTCMVCLPLRNSCIQFLIHYPDSNFSVGIIGFSFLLFFAKANVTRQICIQDLHWKCRNFLKILRLLSKLMDNKFRIINCNIYFRRNMIFVYYYSNLRWDLKQVQNSISSSLVNSNMVYIKMVYIWNIGH